MMFGNKGRARDQLIAKMERQLDLIHTALVVRDPGTAVAVEAYEGLRKQVIAGATARQAHVAQLAEFDVALRRGAGTEDLLALSSQWLDQAGVARIDDPAVKEAFDSSVPPGAVAEVEIPAYVNTVTGQLVRQGRLRMRDIVVEELPPKEESSSLIASPPVATAAAIEGEADADHASAVGDDETPVAISSTDSAATVPETGNN